LARVDSAVAFVGSGAGVIELGFVRCVTLGAGCTGGDSLVFVAGVVRLPPGRRERVGFSLAAGAETAGSLAGATRGAENAGGGENEGGADAGAIAADGAPTSFEDDGGKVPMVVVAEDTVDVAAVGPAQVPYFLMGAVALSNVGGLDDGAFAGKVSRHARPPTSAKAMTSAQFSLTKRTMRAVPEIDSSGPLSVWTGAGSAEGGGATSVAINAAS
jgi:hypothetical protein